MTKPWIASAPRLQARVQPADDGSDQRRVSVTVTFSVSSAKPGAPAPAGPHWHSPLRMEVGAWGEQDVLTPLVLVPKVVGLSQRGAHEALRDAELAPFDLPYQLPNDPSIDLPIEPLTNEVRVVRQAPTGGMWASPGSQVELEYEAAAQARGRQELVQKHFDDPNPPCDLISCEWFPLRIELEFGGWHPGLGGRAPQVGGL